MKLYDTLNISKDCNQNEIKKAYRKLAMIEHPDKGGSPEKFKEINEAYSILSDPQKRRAYDCGQLDNNGNLSVNGSISGSSITATDIDCGSF